MTLGAPLGLLALLGIPIIIGIHMFRRRYRPRPISGSFLYGLAAQSSASGRRRQRLVPRASLWLELLAVLAAAWFLSDPHFATRQDAEHVIFVLDERGSMQALGADGGTAHHRAREAVMEHLADMDRDDRVTFVASGHPPRILIGPNATTREALDALSMWRAESTSHALDEAIGLATELARGPDAALAAKIVIVTDRKVVDLPEAYGLIAVGEARPTSGLADVRWLRGDGTRPERLIVRVTGYGGATRRRALVVSAGGRTVATRSVLVTPGEASTEVIALSGAPPSTLMVSLTGADPLPHDDRVTLLRPPDRTVKAHLALPPASAEPVRRALSALDGVMLVDDAGPDLTFRDVAVPMAGSTTWEVAITPGAGPVALGPFLAARGHWLLSAFDGNGLVWAGGGLADDSDGRALLMAGETVLVSEATRGRQRRITLHADLARSMLSEHPAWPVLIANLVEARRDHLPGPTRTNLPLGQPLRVALPAPWLEARWVTPDGTARTLASGDDGNLDIPGLEAPGEHLVVIGSPEDVGGATTYRVNGLAIDGQLGDLTRCAATRKRAAPPASYDVARRRSAAEHVIPLLIAALAMLLAWRAFRREEAGPVGAKPTATAHRGLT